MELVRAGTGADVELAARAARKARVIELIRRFATLIVVVVLAIAFTATAPAFGSYENVTNVLGQVAVIGVIACGMTFVMLVGGIDLSVGSVALLSAAIAASLLHHEVVPPALAIALAVLAGTVVGVVNGALVEGAGISPVIATLGTLIAVRGLAQLVLLADQSSLKIDDSFVLWIGDTRLLGVPVQAMVMLAAFALAAFALYRCGYGRFVYATGMNPVAAALCGVRVGWLRVSTYVVTGTLAGLGGILIAAQVGVVTPPLGLNLEFSVITAVILGGTAITGGIGRMEGTLLGAVLLGMVLNYMTIRGVSAEWQQAATGFIILAVATLDRVVRGRAGART
jgi:ribose/xylose/arabinose/galactoside ABC-type transport system permease subunit